VTERARWVGQLGQLGGHGGPDRLGRVVAGKVEQHDETGVPLDHGPDGRPTVLADDEVALPGAGHGPVGDLRGPLGDHDLALNITPGLDSPLRLADRPPRPQTAGQFPAQLATSLQVEGLVDGLVGDAHGVIVAEVSSEATGDLLGGVQRLQIGDHPPAQPGIGTQLGRLRASGCDPAACWAGTGR
jgi:hypothetical protein